jgi:cell division protein FtsI/penicillin-binding protein 2
MHGLDAGTLSKRAQSARDPITRWSAEELAARPGQSLESFLDRALNRSYSASPREAFFTGGGIHTFVNFDPAENGLVFTVREATADSVNLAYVRLMRDLVRFHEARLPYDAEAVLSSADLPTRRCLLEEAADEETRQQLARAFATYRGLEAPQIVARLLGRNADSSRRRAMLFYAWNPGASSDSLSGWLAGHGAAASPEEVRRLARAYGSPRLTLGDYGYLLDRDPVEVWCAGELVKNPALSWRELLDRSTDARHAAMSWLFRERNRRAQDLRLRIQIERDAFARMTPYWRRLGFPFERLVPSYATAIGSSSDRPSALADLLGIVVNDGIRRDDRSVLELRFGIGTPYHSVFRPSSSGDERVMDPAVARAIRSVLRDVVDEGTARRVKGAFEGEDGEPLVVGGKTGSGDNRFETFGRAGRLKSSRAQSRTAVFAFYIGDRHFGVLTACVTGRDAEDYGFTSSLPLAVLKLLAPEIDKRLAAPAGVAPSIAWVRPAS